MARQLEKLLCPQCGGNDLLEFGHSAFKCESCGTILRDENEEKAIEKTHFVAPVTTDFTNSLEREKSGFMNSEERYGEDFEEKVQNMDGDSFLKMIIGFGILLIIGLLVAFLLD